MSRAQEVAKREGMYVAPKVDLPEDFDPGPIAADVPPLFAGPVQGRDSDERYTPAWVFEGMGLTFDLDPASPVDGGDFVPARAKFTRVMDGLSRPWEGLVWLNPPFSNASPWARRFCQHGNGVFLGPVANSRWWSDLAAASDLMWLCRDITFVHPERPGRHSSMPLVFVAMGADAVRGVTRLASSGRHGGVLVRPVAT